MRLRVEQRPAGVHHRMDHLVSVKSCKMCNFVECSGFTLPLARLKQEDCHLPQVKINEMPGFMGNIWTKISSNYAMPGRVILFVKFFLYVCCNILRIDVCEVKLKLTLKSSDNRVVNVWQKIPNTIPFQCCTFPKLVLHNPRHLAAFLRTYPHF